MWAFYVFKDLVVIPTVTFALLMSLAHSCIAYKRDMEMLETFDLSDWFVLLAAGFLVLMLMFVVILNATMSFRPTARSIAPIMYRMSERAPKESWWRWWLNRLVMRAGRGPLKQRRAKSAKDVMEGLGEVERPSKPPRKPRTPRTRKPRVRRPTSKKPRKRG